MKYFSAQPIVLSILALSILSCASQDIRPHSPFNAQDQQDTAWQTIDSLEALQLYRQASEAVDSILQNARSTGNMPVAIKATLYQARYLAILEEDGQVKAIRFLESALEQSSFPANAILQSLLGESYANYLKNNHWRIAERTSLADEQPSADIQQWSSERLLKKANELYSASLKHDRLREIPVGKYEVLLKGAYDEWTAPTLLDLLSWRALDFYRDERAWVTRPANRFYIENRAALGTAQEFSTSKFDTPSDTDPQYKALTTFQSLIHLHLQNPDKRPLILADLARLEYCHNNSIIGEKDSLYLLALKSIESDVSEEPLSAYASWYLASYYANRASQSHELPGFKTGRDYHTAMEICRSAINRFPDSRGADKCRNLMAEIERPALSFQTEMVILPNTDFLISVSYRNLERLSLALIRITNAERLLYESMNQSAREQFLKNKQVLRDWQTGLPGSGDYHHHRVEIPVAGIPEGQYLLVASDSPNWKTSKQKHLTVVDLLYVSALGYLARSSNGAVELVVTNRETGRPLQYVETEILEKVYDPANRTWSLRSESKPIRTDEDGIAIHQLQSESYFTIRLILDTDTLHLSKGQYGYRPRKLRQGSKKQTVFFLDRSVYRPGQTVFFKCLIYQDDNNGIPKILPKEPVQLTLYDANRQEINKQNLTTNAFGTVHGSFQIPSSGLTGRMHLHCDAGDGRHTFLVEEYKRPTFEVGFEPLQTDARLGQEIEVTGVAAAYAGSAITAGRVRYRVVRAARFPDYSRSWMRHARGVETEIASGTTSTDQQGRFAIRFPAIPDRSLPQGSRPVFDYRIEADVTDAAGETRSATTTVPIGYTAINLRLPIPESLESDSFSSIPIAATRWNGQAAALKGSYEIRQLSVPDRYIRPRLWEAPDQVVLTLEDHRLRFPMDPWREEHLIQNWPTAEIIANGEFDTGSGASVALPNGLLPPGAYQITLKAIDPSGKPLEVTSYFQLTDLADGKPPYASILAIQSEQRSYEPGEQAIVRAVSDVPDTHVLVERENANGKVTIRRWMQTDSLPQWLLAVHEHDRGNFFWHAYAVRHGRVTTHSGIIRVPWTNKELKVELSTFRDRIEPGKEEQWRLKISGPQRDAIAAELVAVLYDASLDAFAPHNWHVSLYPVRHSLNGFRTEGFSASTAQMVTFPARKTVIKVQEPVLPGIDFGILGNGRQRPTYKDFGMPRTAEIASDQPESAEQLPESRSESNSETAPYSEPPPPPPVRRNLNETVFFRPSVVTDQDGNILLNFTMNEALTRWKFLAFAHTKELAYGSISREVVTVKDLMIRPNVPRFLREGDQIELSARVTNLSDTFLQGVARLELFNAFTMQSADHLFCANDTTLPFSIEAGQTKAVKWTVTVPSVHEVPVVLHRVTAQAGSFSDGEEQVIPILTNRTLVTETMPMTVGSRSKEQFVWNRMSELAASPSLKQHQFVIELTEQPIWYAIQALPWLHQTADPTTTSLFHRYYSNTLASWIAMSKPQIKQVIEAWQRVGASVSRNPLESALTYNADLKSAVLSETPWVLDAREETSAKADLLLLFDSHRLRVEEQETLGKLGALQLNNGGFPWLPGGPDSWHSTLTILEGFGRLQSLIGASTQAEPSTERMLRNATGYIDNRITGHLKALTDDFNSGKRDSAGYHLSPIIIHTLYTRSFFDDLRDPGAIQAYDYFLGQARTHWTKLGLYEQGLIALALHRSGDVATARVIVQSIIERSIEDPLKGRFWKQNSGFFWYQRPLETHALLMEVIDELTHDTSLLESLKIWLLSHKQTNRWPTAKSTADAIYALLMRGEAWEAAPQPVSVQVGGTPLLRDEVPREAGTGYYRKSWHGGEITPALAEIEIDNPNAQITWGACYWQYFENLDAIQAFKETPFTIEKTLFRNSDSPTGPRLEPVTASQPLMPGDLVTVRIILKIDRDMEYVHLKDQRSSGFEPVQVISHYRWQGGLGYYQSTGDLATNFYFRRVPRGTWVFEYPVRVAQSGDFSNGITTAQCLYAPEFSSHSEGIRIQVATQSDTD